MFQIYNNLLITLLAQICLKNDSKHLNQVANKPCFCFFIEPQRVSNISVINNELNDTFNEDLSSQPHHKYGKSHNRAKRDSLKILHVPVRERAAKFEQIAADIRASADMTLSRNSSVSSTQSPPLSPRVSRQISFSWERQIELRLRVNRSRESSLLSSSTSSTSRSGSSRNPVSRSMSSGSAFSDYRQSYSSDDVSFEPVYEVKQSPVMEQFPETEEVPMVPNHCPIERDSVRQARIVQRTRSAPYKSHDDLYENINGNHPPQEELYENIDDARQSNRQTESHNNNLHKHELEKTKVPKQNSIYAVYWDENILEKEYPPHHPKSQEGYHSDGYRGDTDRKEYGTEEAASKSAGEIVNETRIAF